MPSFLTQCPHCLTSFRVTDKQLDAADGLVRCGACLGIFSAAANRITVKQPYDATAEREEHPAEWDDDTPADEDDDAELPDDGLEEEVLEDELTREEPTAETAEVLRGQSAVPARDTAPAEPEDSDADLLEAADYDISLGDMNLDLEEQEEDDEYETDEEYDSEDDDDEYEDDDSDDDDATEDFEEDDEDDDVHEVFEEYEDDEDVPEADDDESAYDDEDADADDDAVTSEESEEFEPEISFPDEEENDALELEATEDLASDDELEPQHQAPAPRRGLNERTASDKTALHRQLATLEDDAGLDPLDDEALDALDEPVLLDTAPPRRRLAMFALLLGNVMLLALLAWQHVDANIETLSRSARFAPLLPFACRIVECPAVSRSQPDRFVSEQLLVRSHPRYAEALEVSLVFRNDAAQAQPFPALELGFHDPANRLIANRLFQPAEYLPPELNTSEMPAQSSIQVMLELVDPGSEAVNYTLKFHAP